MKKWESFLKFLDERAISFGAQYKIFAIYMLTNSPIGYLGLHYMGNQVNESFIVRFIGMLLCIPLLFIEKWPFKLRRYLNLYWYLTLTYSLPFLGTYMTLINHLSTEWLLNDGVGLLMLVLLVDWLMFAILMTIGIISGFAVFMIVSGDMTFTTNALYSFLSFYFYGYAVVIGVFARNKARIDHEKLQTLKTVGGAIAHEMRTPLLVMQTGASALEDHVPTLIDAYAYAKDKGAELPKIPEKFFPILASVPKLIQKTARSAFNIIDMLMANIQENPADTEVEQCSIIDCVAEALGTYPLEEKEQGLITVQIEQDFIFLGVKRLMVHVFFNLIKNALYYIKAARKGTITIWADSTPKYNRLHFKDTGKGISKQVLPRIFERFYGQTRSGTGIGLAFCSMVMRNADGQITCESVEGEHSTFILSFPKVIEQELIKSF